MTETSGAGDFLFNFEPRLKLWNYTLPRCFALFIS